MIGGEGRRRKFHSAHPVRKGPDAGDITALHMCRAGIKSGWNHGCLQRPTGGEPSENDDDRKVLTGTPHLALAHRCQAERESRAARTFALFQKEP